MDETKEDEYVFPFDDENKEEASIEEKPNIFDEFKEDFALLIESGFIGAKQLDEVNSSRLFNAAKVLNPTSAAPLLGLGHISLSKMDIKKATQLFEEAHAMEEDNYIGQCFLAICYFMSKGDKMKKGEKLVKDALQKSDDETVQKLGKVILEWVDKDLSKKMDSPFGR